MDEALIQLLVDCHHELEKHEFVADSSGGVDWNDEGVIALCGRLEEVLAAAGVEPFAAQAAYMKAHE